MGTNYSEHVSTKVTPQSESVLGKAQIKNNAGGFVFEVTDWTRLDRFLILGAEGGTYYTGEREITKESAACLFRLMEAGEGQRVVDRIVEISGNGRAPKNDPAIFALAICAKLGDDATRKKAFASVSRVCRIGTHLFQFAEAVSALGGWGRSTKRAITQWYHSQKPDDLAYQLVKYQQRNGWSHRDLLRLSHGMAEMGPEGGGDHEQSVNAAIRWACEGLEGLKAHELGQDNEEKKWRKTVRSAIDPARLSAIIHAFEEAKVSNAKRTIELIREVGLPRECIKTEHLNDPAVWEALLEKMPMTAMIRNLAKMTAVGLLKPLSNAAKEIQNRLISTPALQRARVHPMQMLIAMLTYKAGHGVRGKLTWSPVGTILEALDAGFYASFGAVHPTNKRWMLCLDVSNSMNQHTVGGVPGLSARMASAAMAMVTARVEKQHHIVAFSQSGNNPWLKPKNLPKVWPSHKHIIDGMSEMPIGPRQRLDDVVSTADKLSNKMGGTDCALPMMYAQDRGIDVDVFVILTDNETWAGGIHPFQALKAYRKAQNPEAKLAVVSMAPNEFSIADPSDAGMFDVVGFDTATPNLLSDFALGGARERLLASSEEDSDIGDGAE